MEHEITSLIRKVLESKQDKYGKVVIPDEFGICGYMIGVNRLMRFLSPIIDEAMNEMSDSQQLR